MKPSNITFRKTEIYTCGLQQIYTTNRQCIILLYSQQTVKIKKCHCKNRAKKKDNLLTLLKG